MYVIGLDVGTTCTKALLADERGHVITVGSSSYPLISSGSHIEQNAQDWIEASVQAIRQVIQGIDATQVMGLSLSTQGGSTVAVDEKGEFIGNSITWMDTRSEAEAAELEAQLGGEYVYHATGWKINPALDAAKICYMKKQPAYENAKMYLSTLEVLNRVLTGNIVLDPTNAAMRQLYNIEQNRWDEKLLEFAGLKEEELPSVLPTGKIVGKLLKGAAERTGLSEGTLVFNGAHDQYCAAIGSGAVNEGDMLLSAGTTWVLMGIGKKPMFTDSYIAPGRHPVAGLYGAMASLVCSGASLQWFKNEFLPEDFNIMNEEVVKRRKKTEELFFYPYLSGANYPVWNLKVRGAFTGLALEHDRFDMARAIMEGVAFGVRRAVGDFESNGCEVQKITMMGGASKSSFWCQILASITHKPIYRLNQADICALGAAMIAACGLGIYKNYTEAAEVMVHTQQIYEADVEETAYYDWKFQKYNNMWDNIMKYYKNND